MNPFWLGYISGIITLVVVIPILAPYAMRILAKRKISNLFEDVNSKLGLVGMDIHDKIENEKNNQGRGEDSRNSTREQGDSKGGEGSEEGNPNENPSS